MERSEVDAQRRLDEFARAAMASLLLAPFQLGDECRHNDNTCAFYSFNLAEAMLAESDRRAAAEKDQKA